MSQKRTKYRREARRLEADKSRDEILREKYMEYVKEEVLPRAQSRFINDLEKTDSELAGYALERMRTSEWQRNTKFAYEWYLKSQLKLYWKRTERLVKVMKRKITILAATSTVISIVCLIVMLYMFL